MKLTTVFLLLVGMTLAVCLVLTITALTVLRNAVSETDNVRQNALAMLEEFSAVAVDAYPSPDTVLPAGEMTEPFDCLFLSTCGDGIGVFSPAGALLFRVDYAVSMLPEEDRLALEAGIEIGSWAELSELMTDLTT